MFINYIFVMLWQLTNQFTRATVFGDKADSGMVIGDVEICHYYLAGDFMKALSIQQPWAWAILNGKNIENRTWSTQFKGQFLIHAGKKFDYDGYHWICKHNSLFPVNIPHTFLVGGIVGKSNIIDCVNYYDSPFFFGPFAFILKDSIATKFIPYRGKLGFFDVSDSIADQAL